MFTIHTFSYSASTWKPSNITCTNKDCAVSVAQALFSTAYRGVKILKGGNTIWLMKLA